MKRTASTSTNPQSCDKHASTILSARLAYLPAAPPTTHTHTRTTRQRNRQTSTNPPHHLAVRLACPRSPKVQVALHSHWDDSALSPAAMKNEGPHTHTHEVATHTHIQRAKLSRQYSNGCRRRPGWEKESDAEYKGDLHGVTMAQCHLSSGGRAGHKR